MTQRHRIMPANKPLTSTSTSTPTWTLTLTLPLVDFVNNDVDVFAAVIAAVTQLATHPTILDTQFVGRRLSIFSIEGT